MPIHRIRALCAGFLLVLAASASAASPINVHIRVEGAKKTLVPARTVTLADAPIVKDGNPAHSCAGQTALGALQQGAQGDWDGSWSEGLGYFVSTIKGEKPSGNAFFELWVNHHVSETGFCGATLKPGNEVLVIVQDCTFNPKTQACPDKITPLAIRAPKLLKRGHHAHLTVVAYTPKGTSTPQPGATVFADGKRLGHTDKHGQISVSGTKLGPVDVYATKTGHVKSETETVRIRK